MALTMEKMTAMLIGHAMADAIGVPVEFSKRAHLKKNPVTGILEYGTYHQPAGTWSDDTSLSIAAMESISRLGKIDYADIMKNFVEWYEHDKFTANDVIFDVGNTTAQAIENFMLGITPLECGPTNESTSGNGSLMRIFPVAAYLYLKRGNNFDADAMQTVHNFSRITHGSYSCQMSCGVYSLIAAEIFDGQDLKKAILSGINKAKNFYGNLREFEEAAQRLARIFDANFANLPEEEISSRGYVIASLESALWCLLNTDNYKDLVLKAVNLGGDTDTIGAIAGGLAGAFYGLEEIPAEWLSALKKKSYLEKIAADFYKVGERND